jgi:hypothetical protein
MGRLLLLLFFVSFEVSSQETTPIDRFGVVAPLPQVSINDRSVSMINPNHAAFEILRASRATGGAAGWAGGLQGLELPRIEMPQSCKETQNPGLVPRPLAPLISSTRCQPIPADPSLDGLVQTASQVSCTSGAKPLNPFVYQEDRKVCECREQMRIAAPLLTQDDSVQRKKMFHQLIDSYVNRYLVPMVKYRAIISNENTESSASFGNRSLVSGLKNAQIRASGLIESIGNQERSCDLGSISTGLKALQLLDGASTAGCTSEKCKQGSASFDQALSEYIGGGVRVNDRNRASMISHLSRRVSGNPGLLHYREQSTTSCLRNSRSARLLSFLPFKSGDQAAKNVEEAKAAVRKLSTEKSRLGNCTDGSDRSINTQLSDLLRDESFNHSMRFVFGSSPLSARVFGHSPGEPAEILKNCRLASNLIDQAIKVNEKIVAQNGATDHPSVMSLGADLHKSVQDIEGLMDEFKSDSIGHNIIRDTQLFCGSLKAAAESISCAKTAPSFNSASVDGLIHAGNFSNVCPGQTLESCQEGFLCQKTQSNSAGLNALMSQIDLNPSADHEKNDSGQEFATVEHMCSGFDEFAKDSEANPCRGMPAERYRTCFHERVLSDDSVLVGILVNFSASLIASSDPEIKMRGLLLAQHSGVERTSQDIAASNASEEQATDDYLSSYVGDTAVNAMSELGPGATNEAIIESMQSQMGKDIAQYKLDPATDSDSKMISVIQGSLLPEQGAASSSISQPIQSNSFIQAPKSQATLAPVMMSAVPSPVVPVQTQSSEVSELRGQLGQAQAELSQLKRTIAGPTTDYGPAVPSPRRTKAKTTRAQNDPSTSALEEEARSQESVATSSGQGFVSGRRRRAPASVNSSAPQSPVQAQAFTPPAGSVVYNSVAEAVTSLDQARIQGGGQLKLRAAGSGAQTSRGGVPLDQILTVSVMDASNVEQVLEGIRAQFNSQILAENEVKFVEVRDGGKSTIYKVQKVNGELVIEEAVSPEEVASGVLIETSQRQPRVVRFTLSGLSSRLNEAIQRD